jgi:hypothetical protein
MESLAAFERGIRQLMAEVEQEMVGEGLSQFEGDVPLELRAGMVDGYWTPLAARQGVW